MVHRTFVKLIASILRQRDYLTQGRNRDGFLSLSLNSLNISLQVTNAVESVREDVRFIKRRAERFSALLCFWEGKYLFDLLIDLNLNHLWFCLLTLSQLNLENAVGVLRLDVPAIDICWKGE